MDGVEVGTDWRAVEEQGEEGGLEGEWKAWGEAEEGD
jgi:hypothetical protein